MLRSLLLALPLLLLLACSDGPPDSADGADAALPPDATPAEAIGNLTANADSIKQDQIEHTRLSDPAAAKTKTPAPKETTTPAPKNKNSQPVAPKKKAVPPPPPTNTAPAPAAPAPAAPPAKESDEAPDHGTWNSLLQKHVSGSGRVNYTGFQTDEAKLDAYLATLAKATPAKDWSRNQSLAYWINAYNAFTVKLILNNWPVKSIQDIDKPWDKKWIQLEGKTYSLNQIEHEIVRPTFKEPRIHFALVCAAESCPPLANRAFNPGNLNSMLESRTRNFIRDEKFNVTQEAVVRVSPLFDWYAEDFGNVRNYLNKYLENDIPPASEINFLDYDWALNN